MAGWKGSTRKARLPSDWPLRRHKRLRADNYQCTWIQVDGARCTAKATDVDHIDAMTDDHSHEALQSLCAWHHLRKSGSEGGAASAKERARRRAMVKRPPEIHPGLIQQPPRR